MNLETSIREAFEVLREAHAAGEFDARMLDLCEKSILYWARVEKDGKTEMARSDVATCGGGK